MTAATLSALFLIGAGFIHSFSYMCRKLPPARRPSYYPNHRLHQIMIDLAWASLLLMALRIAFGISTALGITVLLVHFAVLPFVFQPPLAKLFGFRGLRHYMEAVDRSKAKGKR